MALTFDDGPSSTVTRRLMQVLLEHRVPATFFMVGSRVQSAPRVARAVGRAGFAIGNHTYDHRDLTTLDAAGIRAELTTTARALRAAGVRQRPRLARPPYGSVDDRVRRVVARAGYVPALWTVDSRDWDGLGRDAIVRSVMRQVRERGTTGSVVLHHDGVATSEATLAAVPLEIARLRRAGFCLVALGSDGSPAARTGVVATRA